MAYLDVSPKRLSYLLAQGTHEGELKKFFTESKNQLLLKGAKVQNIPHGREERIRAICEKLSRRTDEVLQKWFSQNITLAVSESLDDVAIYLDAHFSGTDRLAIGEARAICRSALIHLFAPNPSQELLDILREPASKAGSPVELPRADSKLSQGNEMTDEAPGSDDPHGEELGSSNLPVAELIASLIADDESGLETALSEFGPRTRALTTALLLLREGDIPGAQSHLHAIGDVGQEREVFEYALSRARHQPGGAPKQAGARVSIPAVITHPIEEGAREIIGVLTNESDTGAVFVQPVAIVSDGNLLQLAREDCIELFPESGSVMCHKSVLRRATKPRDLVRWVVAERDRVEGRTRFHMEIEKGPPIRVVQLPVPSLDPDEVRTRIRSYAETSGWNPGEQCFFVLLDGLAVLSPKTVDVARDDAFHNPWQVWTSLDTWIIEGRQYCLDLPVERPSLLDLSPIELAFSRLLKSLDVQGRFLTSKAQRKELVELLEMDEAGGISDRTRRISASVRQMSINMEQVEMVLELLGSHDDVKRRIDEIVSIGVDARLREKQGLSDEIVALRARKADLEREGRDIERRNRAHAKSVDDVVKSAFDSAIEKGAATLASAEIMRVLGGRGKRVEGDERAMPAGRMTHAYTLSGSTPDEAVRERLRALGISAKKASILISLVAIARRAGAALLVGGSLARQCVQEIARSGEAPVTFVEIPMGLTSSVELKLQLDGTGESEAIALLGADLSPMDVYGGVLLDRITMQARREVAERALIIGACVGGELSLPIPASWRKVSLIVDLDSSWDDEEARIEELEDGSFPLLRHIRDRVVEELGAVDDRLRHHLERAVVRAMLTSPTNFVASRSLISGQ